MTNQTPITPLDIPREFLDKYHRSGPRYTSYPTAPQFKSDFSRDEIAELWKKTNQPGKGLSIYTHFPFCKVRCLYCGCFTHTGKNDEAKAHYLEGLKRELDAIFGIIDPSRPIHQLAFGGGTPTYMRADQLADYMQHLSGLATFAPDAERSIEVDPRSVDENDLDRLLDIGFNRFSFGVQDLDPDVQKKVNRVLDENILKQLVNHLRSQKMGAINLDLIYGLPGQTPESFDTTVNKIIDYRPTRIALFGYAHVPWVSPHQKAMEKHHIPTPAERTELFGRAFKMLLQAGYRHVGMDHFALPNDELVISLDNRTLTRNFMGYTTRRGLDLVGIGTSSISSVGITYAQNGKEMQDYLDNPTGPHWTRALVLDDDDELRREIIIDLFCNFYLDTRAVEKKFNIDFAPHFAKELEALAPMQEDDLIHIEKDALTVTDMGRFFIRNICMHFDRYLVNENPENRYSKTL